MIVFPVTWSFSHHMLRTTASRALLLFGCAIVIYTASAHLLERTESPSAAYFNYLADAFLHGRLYLLDPPATNDLTLHDGRWYVTFPPLPALLLLPWVALAGLAHTNTVLFTNLMGAVNVVLVFLLLQALSARGWSQLQTSDNLWLTALFGIGSVHWYMSTLGSVWFMAQICTATFMLLATWIAMRLNSPLLAGAALAVAMLARPHVALCYPLLLGIAWQHAHDRDEIVQKWWRRWVGLSVAPLIVSAALLLAYNAVRFGSPFDFGYLQQNVARPLADELRQYGQFNLHYLGRNLWSMLLATPQWDRRGRFLPIVEGMSIFLTTPALAYLVKARQRTPLVVGAWLAVGLLLLPLLTYYNTGWWQFGYRFSLDFMTPVMVLLAVAAGKRISWPLRLLILLGIAMNAWGVWWFLNPRYFS